VNYCSECGKAVALRIPPGDHLPRFVCDACGTIHYQNPRIVAGCVAEWRGRILLCKRAIEPRLGYWTIPAGFMANGETTMAAAARESHEEALAKVDIGSLLAIVHVLHANQVHMMYRATLVDGTFGTGAESLESKLVEESEVPWSDIAFPSVDYALRRYFADRSAGREDLHITEIDRRRAPAPDRRTE
jgi:ADP-ribose pyrophosphatase YjhB (NUDIX family)